MSSKNIVRFRSCFICEVNISDDEVELIDSTHTSFFISKSNDELISVFKDWFVSIYKACIPQTLTVIQYDVENNDDEPMLVVKNLIYNKPKDKPKMLIESKEQA